MSAAQLLDPAGLLAAARAETGLTHFDGPGIEEPLERLTRALQAEADLNEVGVHTWRARLLNTLITRLRARDWFHRHPDILEEQLPPPVVILGLARTGTTLLHRLLATDPRFYAAAWWEVRFPVPVSAEDIQGEQRIPAAKLEVAGILQAMPDLAAIHPWDAMGADEDIMLIDQTLLSTTAESLACVPSYRDWIHSLDLRPAYGYLVQLMQFLQWQKKRHGQQADYWVLKTPMHLGYVEVIAELMPGATFVQTHRDPLTTMPSFASFVHVLWAMNSGSADAREAARQWSQTLEEHLNHCMDQRERLPNRFIDVDFRDTVNAPVGVAERIYQGIGLPMTPATRSGISAYMDTHPREGRPKHEYTLEEFGFTRSELERRFRRYREKHILPFQKS
ncbi:MAG TPA: sulfotransferase [Steroidobacteraceae bacterium]|nr:sulfotransferase [Steroidobacteraceae bacterium]